MSTLNVRARIGFWLAVVLAVVDVAGTFIPPPPAAQGPPVVVQVLSGVLGLATLVAAVLVARRGSRIAVRVMAVTRIVSGLTALPAFFEPDVPAAFVAWGAATVVLTVVAVVLLMGRARDRATPDATAGTTADLR